MHGWAGKILKVDLTNRTVTEEPIIPKYEKFIGSDDIGFKVMWDEVPPGTESQLDIGEYNQ